MEVSEGLKWLSGRGQGGKGMGRGRDKGLACWHVGVGVEAWGRYENGIVLDIRFYLMLARALRRMVKAYPYFKRKESSVQEINDLPVAFGTELTERRYSSI